MEWTHPQRHLSEATKRGRAIQGCLLHCDRTLGLRRMSTIAQLCLNLRCRGNSGQSRAGCAMRYLYQCMSRAVSARETRRAGTVGRALTATSRNGEAVPVNPRRNEERGRRRWLVVDLLCESLVAALALVLC